MSYDPDKFINYFKDFIYLFIYLFITVTYPDFFWVNRYTHRTYEVTTMVCVEQVFLNVCLQIL